MKVSRKLTLSAALAVLVTALPGSLFVYQQARDRALQAAAVQLADETDTLAATHLAKFEEADASLNALALTLNATLALPPRAEEPAEFDRLIGTDPDGARRNRRPGYDGQREAGVFLPPDAPLTDDVKRLYLRVKQTLDLFGAAATKHFANVWWIGHDRGEVIFDHAFPEFVFMMAPDNDYTGTPWMTLTSPEQNPGRRTLWTPALFDPVPRTWMVSAVHPLDVNGQWLGTIGHDLLLSRMVSAIFAVGERYADEHHFLLDAGNRYILAGPWQALLEAKADGFRPDLAGEPELAALLAMPPDHEAEGKVQGKPRIVAMHGVDHLAIALRLKAMDWRYFRLIPVEEVLAPLNALFKAVVGVLIAVAVLVAIGMGMAVRRSLVQPMLQLSVVAGQWGSGQLEARVPPGANDEVGTLAAAFNRMAENLDRDRQTIRASDANYRAVTSAVREVILRLSADGRVDYLNPAWTTLTGYPIEDSLGRPFADFVADDERAPLAAALDGLARGEVQAVEREYALVTHDGRDLHVEASFAPVAGREGGIDGIAGILNDVTDRYFRTGVDALLREIDRRSLAGEAERSIAAYCAGAIANLFRYPFVQIGLMGKDGIIDCCVSSNRDGAASAIATPEECCGHGSLLQSASQAPNGAPRLWRTGDGASGHCEAEALGLRSGCALVMRAHGSALGVLGLYASDEAAFDPAVVERLADLANRLGAALRAAADQQWLRIQHTALESASNVIFITDRDGQITWVNDAFVNLTGYAKNEVVGSNPRLLKSGLQGEEHYRHLWQTILAGKPWRGEVTNRRKDGRLYTAIQTISPFASGGSGISHFVAVHEDITVIKEHEKRIEYLATHDVLTKLPNRALLDYRLRMALEHCQRTDGRLALLFVDLDHFKHINDSLGHSVGDRLLQIVSMRMTACLRREDTLCRLGGDEFVILINDVSREEEVSRVAGKLLDAIARPISLEGQEFRFTGSAGIATYPGDGDSAETLMRNADTAMYRAKEEGRGRFCYYTAEMNERVRTRLLIESRISRAVDERQFLLHYQPQIDLRTGRAAGMEALVRWLDPEHGQLVPPAQFIPFAEESGVIVRLGAWVMEEAVAQVVRWRGQGIGVGKVSVNLSPKQLFHRDFLGHLGGVIRSSGIDPGCLVLEITESAMISDLDAAIAAVQAIKDLGIAVAIDDFGTGYSSLGYLLRLPIDIVKLDRKFIDGLAHRTREQAIVRNVLELLRSLDLTVVAEGVETEQQADILRGFNCDQAQGYLFSRPLPAREVENWLAGREAAS